MDVFEALGLSAGEKKVYAALIKSKSTTTGPLYKRAGVSQSKVYEILDRLKKKGLVSSIVKDNMTYWQPSNPQIVLENLERELEVMNEKKNILEEELPILMKETYPKDEAQVFIGYNGFRSVLFSFLDTLKKGDEFVVFGSPVEIPDPFYSFLKAFNNDRVRKGIYARFLYGESLKKFAKKLYDVPKTKLKFMKGLTPSTIAIGNDRIIIMEWKNGGKFVVITGIEIAKSYRTFFASLWKMAKL